MGKEREIIDTAMARLKRCVEAEAHNRQAAAEDLDFANGEQWSGEERKRRTDKGRPVLQFNLLQKYIDQVVGDMLHNMPSVKIRPEDSRADINIAKIRQGAINNIFYLSDFKGIYNYAARQQTTCGYGAWRVLTRYTEENPFLQEAYLKSIRNPFLVYLDPDAQDQFGADAKFGFILEKIRKDDYKRRYPRAKSAPDTFPVAGGDLGEEHWYDDETVTVAEYFTVGEKEVEMFQLASGEEVTQEGFDEKVSQWQERNEKLLAKVPAAVGSNVPGPPTGAMQVPPSSLAGAQRAGGAGPQPVAFQLQAEIEQMGPEPVIVRSRMTKVTEIRHRVITAFEILDGGTDGNKFPGKYIPIVLSKGKELNVNGKNYVYSLIRNAKDPQKMFNYWHCLELGTKLPTPSGWTTMGEVQEGDELLDDQGQICSVLGVSPVNTGRECYRVTFDDGNSIVTDAGHLWQVEERLPELRTKVGFTYNTKVIKTTELRSEVHAIYNTKPLDLPEVALSIHPYVLGAWLGDGDSGSGRITSGRNDYKDMVGVLDDLGVDVGGVMIDHGNNGTAAIRITGLTTGLRSLGVWKNKHIPIAFLRASHEQRLLLLQGLMDTDGSIHRGNFVCTFCNTNEQLIAGVKELLHSLGIRFSVTERAGRSVEFSSRDRQYTTTGKSGYQINFTVPTGQQIFRLPRKLIVQQEKDCGLEHPRRTARRKVKSVIRVDSVPTKCVAVDSPSHLFLAGEGMIPTHNTAAAEYIALAPKSPWVGTAKQFEGYEKDYAAANVENFPMLKYNADPDAQGPPQRTGAPPVPDAIFVQASKAEDLIKSTIGMYNADVGAPGSEQTGAAIIARQRPGDVGTYEFSVNMARAVEYTGKILNEIIPEIYDSERDIRVRFLDETETFVPVNTTVESALRAVEGNPEAYKGLDAEKLRGMLQKEGREARFNDITAGKYGVVVTTGPSYATQRQESSQALLMLMQAAPQEMSVALDLIAKNMDFKDADELENRLRKPLLAKGIIKPRAGEEIPQIPPDPAAQAEMAQAQARVQVAQVALERESLQVQEAALRLKAEIAKIQAETGQKIDTTILDAIESERKHSIEASRVQLERERLDHQREKDKAEISLKAVGQYLTRRLKSKGGK